MVLKLWDIDNGKVTYLKHTNNKNESRIIKLIEPAEPDRIPMSKMEEALDLVFGLVSSIKKLNNVETVNGGKDNNVNTKPGNNVEDDTGNNVEARPDTQIEAKPETQIEAKPDVNIEPWVKVSLFSKEHIDPWVKRHVDKEKNVEAKPEVKIEAKPEVKIEAKPEVKVETRPEVKVEAKPEVKVEAKPEVKVEKWAWEEEYDKDNGKEVPKEVSDKLNLLLQEGEERKDGVQFLINKNAKKGLCDSNSSLPLPNVGTDTAVVIPKEDIVGRKKLRTKRKRRYSGYKEAIVKCVPRILKDIEDSNDAKTLVSASDLAKRMGDEFDDIDPLLLYSNVRYKFLYYHDLAMNMLSSNETDVYTSNGEKIFRFRIKNDHDKLPDSVLKQMNSVNK